MAAAKIMGFMAWNNYVIQAHSTGNYTVASEQAETAMQMIEKKLGKNNILTVGPKNSMAAIMKEKARAIPDKEEKSKNTSTHDGAPQQQKPTHDPKVAIESAYRIDRYCPMHTASRLPRPLNRNGRCRVPPSLSILNALIS